MNEAFPKRLGGIDQTAREQRQKLIRFENAQNPEGLKSLETLQASEDPKNHLRQTVGDQEQKLIKCEDPESHLRQTARDKEQKLTSFHTISLNCMQLKCFYKESMKICPPLNYDSDERSVSEAPRWN